jgi:hypothetical protein
MRTFALIYPQLMNQAMASGAGFDETALAALRRSCELAERACDGVYRPNGTPFLCHVTRTASIVLAERQPPVVVYACLLHAVHALRYGGGRRHLFAWQGSCRDVRAAAGEATDRLLHAYDQLAWNSAEALRQHLERLGTYDDTLRQAVVMRLANELEDHLDQGVAYGSPEEAAARGARRGACTELARRLGAGELATELDEVLAAAGRELPAGLVTNRRQAYSQRTKRLPELSALRRVARRVLRRLRR